MTFHILNNSEKNKIKNYLNEHYGIIQIPGTIIQIGKERLFLFQGSLNEKQIKSFESTIPVERIGTYFAKFVNEDIKLSIEGVQLLQNQITKNIFEINNSEAEEWMMGRDLLIEEINKDKVSDFARHNSVGAEGADGERIHEPRITTKTSGVASGREGTGSERNRGHYQKIKKGFIIIKNNQDFLGSGKASEEKIGNFIPKSRRLREKS